MQEQRRTRNTERPLYELVKRLMDIALSVVAILVLSPILLVVALLVRFTSRGPVILVQDRAGYRDRLFRCYKFRTMVSGTPEVATDKLQNPEQYVTRAGYYLRKYSLDELPQLFNILLGDMSFVGPRPALHNQYDLRRLRNQAGVSEIRPGLTGWAQVNGRDDIPQVQKVALDTYYLHHRSFLIDLLVVYRTVFSVANGTGMQSTTLRSASAGSDQRGSFHA